MSRRDNSVFTVSAGKPEDKNKKKEVLVTVDDLDIDVDVDVTPAVEAVQPNVEVDSAKDKEIEALKKQLAKNEAKDKEIAALKLKLSKQDENKPKAPKEEDSLTQLTRLLAEAINNKGAETSQRGVTNMYTEELRKVYLDKKRNIILKMTKTQSEYDTRCAEIVKLIKQNKAQAAFEMQAKYGLEPLKWNMVYSETLGSVFQLKSGYITYTFHKNQITFINQNVHRHLNRIIMSNREYMKYYSPNRRLLATHKASKNMDGGQVTITDVLNDKYTLDKVVN